MTGAERLPNERWREMALYEYKCAECEERFDLMRPMSAADDVAACPECGSEDSRRVISNFASITPGASSLATNPVVDARMAGGGGGGRCGGGWGFGPRGGGVENNGGAPVGWPTPPPNGTRGVHRGGFR